MGPGCIGSEGKCTYDKELILHCVTQFFYRTNLLSIVKAVVSFDRDGVGRDVTRRRRGRER